MPELLMDMWNVLFAFFRQLTKSDWHQIRQMSNLTKSKTEQIKLDSFCPNRSEVRKVSHLHYTDHNDLLFSSHKNDLSSIGIL